MSPNINEEYSHYKKIIKSFHTAFLISIDDQKIKSRPMAIANIDDSDNSVWFFSSDITHKVLEIQQDSKSAVACMNESTMITISGNSKLIHDRDKLQELWKEEYRPWFPQGIDTQHIVLICFEPMEAEYWDNRGENSLRYIFNTVKAVASGNTPAIAEGSQHGRVIL